MKKALERWGVVSEAIPWHLCAVFCGCVVKRGPQVLAALSGWSGLWSCAGCEGLPLPSRSVLPCCQGTKFVFRPVLSHWVSSVGVYVSFVLVRFQLVVVVYVGRSW